MSQKNSNNNNSGNNDMIADLLSKLRQSIDKEGIKTSEEYLDSAIEEEIEHEPVEDDENSDNDGASIDLGTLTSKEDADVHNELLGDETSDINIDDRIDDDVPPFDIYDEIQVSEADDAEFFSLDYDDEGDVFNGVSESSTAVDSEASRDFDEADSKEVRQPRVYRIKSYTPASGQPGYAEEMDIEDDANVVAEDKSHDDFNVNEGEATGDDAQSDRYILDDEDYLEEFVHVSNVVGENVISDEDETPTAVFATVNTEGNNEDGKDVVELIGDDMIEALEDEEYIFDALYVNGGKAPDEVSADGDRVDDDMITRPEQIPDTDSFTRVIINDSHTSAPAAVMLKAEERGRRGVNDLFVNTSTIVSEDNDDLLDGTEEIVGGEAGYLPEYEDYGKNYKIASSKEVKRRTGTFTAVKEYTSRDQIQFVFSEYRSKILLGRLSLVALAFLTTFLVIFENVGMVGVSLPWMFDLEEYSRVGILIDLQVVILAVAMTWRKLYIGLCGIVKNKVSYHSLLVPMILLAFAHSVALFIVNEPSPKLFGSIVCMYLLVIIVGDNSVLRREYNTFKVMSASGDKLAACIMNSGAVRGEQEQFSSQDEKFKSYKILRIKKVGFVDGFFSRKDKDCENRKLNMFLLIFIVSSSLVSAVITGFVENDVTSAISAATLCAALAVPSSLFFVKIAPMNRASAGVADSETVIVGESSAREYANINALSFEDVEMFPSKNVKVRRIKLYGDNRLDKVLYYMSSLFSFVGGPLAGVFSVATSETGVSSDVQFVDATEDGLIVMVDGVNISVGKGSFMQRIGVALSYDSEDEKQSADRNISIMFAAVDGYVCAKFYVRYTADRSFEDNVSRLADSDIKTVIRSYDPNLDNNFLTRISCFDVKAVKKTKSQLLDFAQPRIDSGIITRSASSDILRAVLMCKRVVRKIARGEKYTVVLSVLGASAAIAIGAMSLIGFAYSWITVAYSALILIPVAIASRFSI